MTKKHIETEVRFLDIEKEKLIATLRRLKAEDRGEDFLTEIIFYDRDKTWLDQQRFVRIRTDKNGTRLSYKHQKSYTADGTKEIEFSVSDIESMEAFLFELGIEKFRIQEKMRHTFFLDAVTIDIDEWPSIPPYVELEGASEVDLRKVAQRLGLLWEDAVFENAKIVIEETYNVPVSKFRYFTFEKME